VTNRFTSSFFPVATLAECKWSLEQDVSWKMWVTVGRYPIDVEKSVAGGPLVMMQPISTVCVTCEVCQCDVCRVTCDV
jgi:hypothetical protein